MHKDRHDNESHNDWMTAREVSRYLCIPLSTLRKLTREGRIPFLRLSPRTTRFSKAALDDWTASKLKGGE